MKKNWIQLMLLLKRNGVKRADYLRRHQILGSIGENVSYRPYLIPSEPKCLYIGNNVKVSAGVRFVTHDVINEMLNSIGPETSVSKTMFTGVIKVGNNVVIGADSIVLYNKTIGNNVIIAAGSVVCKDIPDNEVWGGNPAKRICSFDEFVQRRKRWNSK